MRKDKTAAMKTSVWLCIAAFGCVAVSARADEGKADGQAIYEAKCAICHGKDGKGATKMGEKQGIKDLTDEKYQATFTDDQLTKAIKEGIKDGEKVRMKAFDKLTDEEIKAVSAYVRSLAKKAGEAAK